MPHAALASGVIRVIVRYYLRYCLYAASHGGGSRVKVWGLNFFFFFLLLPPPFLPPLHLCMKFAWGASMESMWVVRAPTLDSPLVSDSSSSINWPICSCASAVQFQKLARHMHDRPTYAETNPTSDEPRAHGSPARTTPHHARVRDDT